MESLRPPQRWTKAGRIARAKKPPRSPHEPVGAD